MGQSAGTTTLAVWILSIPPLAQVRVWGIVPAERLRRVVRATGVKDEYIHVSEAMAPDFADAATVVMLRADYVFDERLVRALLTTPNTMLVAPAESGAVRQLHAVAAHFDRARVNTALQLFSRPLIQEEDSHQLGMRLVVPTDLMPAYSAALRKSDPPYLLPVRDDNAAEIETRTFAASYKGLTDLVTKFVWPRPARVVTRWCANAGVTPNLITFLSWLLVVLVTWLFLRGDFGLGLVFAWLMTFLDTVDGKLARVTLTSSRVGHVLDHGLDILHPPFWYLAWTMGLLLSPEGGSLSADSDVVSWLRPAGMITVVGYIVGRLIEGLFMLLFKMEIHCWQPIDAFFRLITARRNPNLLLLSAATLVGRPDIGLVLVALWTLFSIGFHSVRVLQAVGERLRGRSIAVWQEPTAGSEIQRQWESVA